MTKTVTVVKSQKQMLDVILLCKFFFIKTNPEKTNCSLVPSSGKRKALNPPHSFPYLAFKNLVYEINATYRQIG